MLIMPTNITICVVFHFFSAMLIAPYFRVKYECPSYGKTTH